MQTIGGRTYQWGDLPERLWACAGVTLPDTDAFLTFGQLRNRLQHLGVAPEVDAARSTMEFVFGVLDPFIHESFGLYAVDHDEDCERYLYLVGALVQHEIPFLVSPMAAECWKDWDVDWSASSEGYRDKLLAQIRAHGHETS